MSTTGAKNHTQTANEMTIGFPGGKRVSASYGELEILTDQPQSNGGDGQAPAPFDLLLASLGTCAGYYVLSFCQTRDISTEGLAIRQTWERDPETHRVTDIALELHLPAGFPTKYEKAIVRATQQCSVKKLLADPPKVELTLSR